MVRPSLILSFLMVWVCLRSWSLKGDWRGPVGSPGVNSLEGCFEGTVTRSLSESLDKSVSFRTRSLKEFMFACTKVVAFDDFLFCFVVFLIGNVILLGRLVAEKIFQNERNHFNFFC